MAKEISLSLDMTTVTMMDNNGNATTLPLANNGVKISNVNGNIDITPAFGGGSGDETVLSTNDNLWQVAYDTTSQTFFVVGITDVDQSKTPQEHHFPMVNNDVYFKRIGNQLVIDSGSN